MRSPSTFDFPMLRLLTALFLSNALLAADTTRPNIIFILCDDMGYGDVKCLNPEGKIPTPQLDAMAARGMTFTDAHSSSAVCTPTRYSVMTGRYNWRTKLQQSVLGGLSPRLIEQGRITVASMLKEKGYHTACVGKWHLGMDWVKLPGKEVSELSIETADQVYNVDYTQPISNGPTAVGFDYYFGISASLDMVPYCFIENDRVTVQPTEVMKLAMNATARNKNAFTREGPGAPGFRGEDVLPAFTQKAIEIIQRQAAASKEGKPFFIYMPLNSPHTPILPSAQWQGKSGISLYADFMMETDDAIGQVIQSLEKNGIKENTLVIVTSDNGCSPSADYEKLAQHGHNPSAKLRGHKADAFDGGHRVPFILQWPAVVKPGSTTAALTGMWDFMATVAEITGSTLPENAAEDSISFLPLLKDASLKPVRDHLVSHSINGTFAIREGKWKLILAPDSGGWSEPRPAGGRGGLKAKNAESAPAKKLPPVQLYDLEADIGETKNLQGQHPELVQHLTDKLQTLVKNGRTTPGAPQQNAVEPDLFRYSKH
jgi:arylsulfatase A